MLLSKYVSKACQLCDFKPESFNLFLFLTVGEVVVVVEEVDVVDVEDVFVVEVVDVFVVVEVVDVDEVVVVLVVDVYKLK